MLSATNTVAETAIRSSLYPNSLGGPLSDAWAGSPISPEFVESLRHFDLFTSHTLGAPVACGVMRSGVLPLASSV